jgi:hypothetical protein
LKLFIFTSQEATHGPYKRLWDKVQRNLPDSLNPDSNEIRRNVEAGGYATTASKIGLRAYMANKRDINLILLREEYYKAGFGIVIKQGMPYKRHFDKV